jgi:hypothetical protein
MADLDRLLAAFEAGQLHRPDAARPNFVDLIHAVLTIAGAPDLPLSDNAHRIGNRLGQPDHLVLVVVDGLGTHFVDDDLPPEAWLARHHDSNLQSVFPSTTASAITSIATGAWPAEHGAIGWWTYLPQLREMACLLPFTRHRDGVTLVDCGVRPAEAFAAPPLFGRLTRAIAVSQPEPIIDSAYSTWFADGATPIPYDTPADAAASIAARIRGADAPTFTYWYIPSVDHQAHQHGTTSEETRTALATVDAALASLADALAASDARIVVTADHGHLDVGARFPIDHEDPLCEFLRTAPSGDMRISYFHLQDGARQPFVHEFHDRFGDHFALISAQHLDDLRLLGPDPLSDETRRRVGDFASLALDDSVMRYTGGPDGEHVMNQRSHHSGLSAREMTIPLVIA